MASLILRSCAAVGLSVLFAMTGACGGTKHDAKSPSSGSSSSKAGPAEVGKAAPDLSIQTVNGKGSVSLDSLSGKIVIVDFWATWCVPCKQSFPKLEELSKRNPDKIVVVGVAVDDTNDQVADFAKQNGATFAVGWDSGHEIANRWAVSAMPTTYVIDETGKVRYIHAGYHDDEPEKIIAEINTLGSEPAGAKPKDEKKDDKKDEKKEEVASAAPAPAPAADAPADDAAPKKAGKKPKGRASGKKAPAGKGKGKGKK